jgi:hypothetical protein
MKKTIINLTLASLIISLFFSTSLAAQASATSSKTSTTKKVATTKVATKTKTVAKPVVKLAPVKWAASGLKSVARIPSGVRTAYKKKVENYARRNNIKLITATVVNNMRE